MVDIGDSGESWHLTWTNSWAQKGKKQANKIGKIKLAMRRSADKLYGRGKNGWMMKACPSSNK